MKKSDSELIEEIKNGSIEYFDHLMKRYEHQVYRVVFSFIKNQDQTLDVVQNIFIKTYQNLKRFRGDCQFKTWLIRIAVNESHNWMKSNKDMLSMEDIGAIPDKTGNQENEFVNKENAALLSQGLKNLSKKYRTVVNLRYFEEYSIREIADILGYSEGVVKNILFRSLQKLKKILKTS